MSYQKKYQKYKKKYLELKAGADGSTDFINENSCIFDENGIAISGSVCPGQPILLSRPTVEFNKDTSIYLIMGHGCDLYQEKIIPANCKYVTRSICGKNANSDNIFKKLLYNFSENSSIINNPEQKTLESNYNDTDLLQYIRIHDAWTTYINSKNSSVFDLNFSCGLYRIGEKPLAIFDANEDEYNNYDFKTVEKTGTLLEFFSNHYNQSLFPTKDDAINILNKIFNKEELNIKVDEEIIDGIIIDEQINNRRLVAFFERFKNAMRDNFSIDFSTLMEKFPGVHYNINCRPLCKGVKTREYDEDKSPRVENIRNRYQQSNP